jgi:hypothetical protein
VSYSLVGEHSSDFSVNYNTGEVTVANPALLDRENTPDITVQVMASDGAPPETRRTVAIPVSEQIHNLVMTCLPVCSHQSLFCKMTTESSNHADINLVN